MVKLQFRWKIKTGTYQTGENLYLNRIRVAGFSWNSSRSQNDTEAPKWAGQIGLPSLKNNRVYGHSEMGIRTRIEQVVTAWFKEIDNG